MEAIKTVPCPTCGCMNDIPLSISLLLHTQFYRGDDKTSEDDLAQIRYQLNRVEGYWHEQILRLLTTHKHSDLNEWIDVECVNTRKPFGRHTFRYNLSSGEVKP